MTANRDVKDFVRLIEALHPWLNQIVAIGGWAYGPYRLHPLAQQLEYEPLATFDTDVAVLAHLSVAGPNMHECSIASGFLEEKLGEAQPPAAHYRRSRGFVLVVKLPSWPTPQIPKALRRL